MDPAQALSDLTEISSQIEAAVVLDKSGGLVGSTIADDARVGELAQAARELLAAAGRAGEEGKELAQLEVATTQGSVFIVRDEENTIAAVTTPEPTVGLVFYDLKSCLRWVAADEPKKGGRPCRRESEGADGAP